MKAISFLFYLRIKRYVFGAFLLFLIVFFLTCIFSLLAILFLSMSEVKFSIWFWEIYLASLVLLLLIETSLFFFTIKIINELSKYYQLNRNEIIERIFIYRLEGHTDFRLWTMDLKRLKKELHKELVLSLRSRYKCKMKTI